MNGTNAEDNGQAAAQDGTTVSPSTDQSDPSDGAGDRGEESLKEELTRLEIKLEEMEAALAASREETLRALADMQNLRRRTAREVQQARDFAVEGFARDLLNVSDNMERALNAIPDSQEVGLKALAEGIRLVQTELKRVFGNHGVTRIETVGQTFDPNLHQAVQQVVAPGVVPGSVVSELQSGFLLNGRLLRASMVVVAKDGE
ncbi:MAG: nucleotide exchange factor GrpE [Magnetococcales bacterium]|nr:nucleotide exchange factor GrpE [Magnetococcales bacterium]MBF0631156.1 nucleotide exchange factor GrpE [Magnetococcales bacterium]